MDQTKKPETEAALSEMRLGALTKARLEAADLTPEDLQTKPLDEIVQRVLETVDPKTLTCKGGCCCRRRQPTE